MSGDITIFKRVEKKYLLTGDEKAWLLQRIGGFLMPDDHGRSTICSLYLDTPDHLLIRNSLDATVYKEKLRLRSYGVPHADSRVFLELKKKYKGVVYKRRVATSLLAAERYFDTGQQPEQSQIMAEMEYAMQLYRRPQPAMFIACEREAFFVKDLPHLRLTFDEYVRCRDRMLRLEDGADGMRLLPEDRCLLEVKTDGAMPLWLSHTLNEAGIFPTSFSKYGMAYREMLSHPQLCHQKGA